MAQPDDPATETDEWEYEYHDTETEHLYFTIDLTTHVPYALAQYPPCNKNANGGSKGSTPVQQSSTDDQDERATAPPSNKNHNADTRDTLQIIDLHTRNPLLKFNHGIYSCCWSTDYGSQLYIAKAGIIANPCRAGSVLDVVGLSRARLLAKPVTLRERKSPEQPGTTAAEPIEVADENKDEDDAASNANADQAEEPAIDSNTAPQPQSSTQSKPSQPFFIPPESRQGTTSEAAASFLERFAAIKQRKGETDQIPIYSVKIYDPPSAYRQEVLRNAALEGDAKARGEPVEDLPNPRPQKRRHFRRVPRVERLEEDGNGVEGSQRGLPRPGPVPRDRLARMLGFEMPRDQPDEEGALGDDADADAADHD